MGELMLVRFVVRLIEVKCNFLYRTLYTQTLTSVFLLEQTKVTCANCEVSNDTVVDIQDLTLIR